MLDNKVFKRGINGIFAMHRSLRQLNEEETAIYYLALRNIAPEVFLQACQAVAESKETPWNPVAAIKEEAGKIVGNNADSAYLIIDDLLSKYYHPDYGRCITEILCTKLEEMGRTELIPLMLRWGPEIYARQNPTATRAQFKKAYESEINFTNSKKQLKAAAQPLSLYEVFSRNLLEPGDADKLGTAGTGNTK